MFWERGLSARQKCTRGRCPALLGGVPSIVLGGMAVRGAEEEERVRRKSRRGTKEEEEEWHAKEEEEET